MSKIAQVISTLVCCFSVTVSSSVFAQGPDRLVASRVKPHLAAYADCAKQYLGQAAKKDPTTSFDLVESSLRPACGSQIDLAREILFRGNFSRSEANAIIRSAYASMQPELRSSFEQAASSERQRRQVEKDQALQPRHGETGSVPQDQIKAVELERAKFLKEASGAFDNCLVSEMKSLVPSSTEPAETLTKVIEIKCGDLENRLVGLGVAFYGASKEDGFQTIVKQPLEERKKRLVADIVTLRADLAKEAAKQPRQVPEADAGSKPSNGN